MERSLVVHLHAFAVGIEGAEPSLGFRISRPRALLPQRKRLLEISKRISFTRALAQVRASRHSVHYLTPRISIAASMMGAVQ